jgi:hypothetical protein
MGKWIASQRRRMAGGTVSQMSFLKQALALAEQGFYVFPLQVNSKLPQIDDFPNRATRDPAQIKRWWLDPVLELEQPYNIGISTTKYNGSQALVVVDVDNKGKKKGSEELLRMELEGHDFVETATQVTPTGGLHLVYRAKEPVKQGQSVLGPGLDIRSKGGYIVGQGSVIDGKPYHWKQGKLDVQPCPEWIIQACGRAIEKETREEKVDVNLIRAEARVKFYLENEAPVSVEGQGGDETAYKVAAKCKDFGMDLPGTVDLMLGHWNDRCEPPWAPEEVKAKVEHAFRYGVNVQGAASPEADFTPVNEYTDKNYLKKINEQYAVLFNEGEVSVLFETRDEKGRPKREFLKESTFKRKFSPYTVQQGRGPAKTYADIWLDWTGRREFAGLCFRPELEPRNNYYNLWRGFAYKQTAYGEAGASARLGFDMFLDHAKANVCGGDEKLFTWLMGYFAHMVQKPYERPLTTLVFRGSKGVGKNVLIDRIGKLLGSAHFLTAHDSRYLTSNFNGHLDSCLMLVLDEAFWSGDKSAEGKLKGLTTAPEIMIERKGKEPYMVDNLVRLVVIGNEDWLVPASADERRYAVFDVGEGKKQNREYFGKMRLLVDEKGGAEILMHYLKHFDLSKVDVNDAPHTKGLADQKLDSLSAFEHFWHQCLTEGKIVNAEFMDKWELQIDKAVFRRAFAAYCKERNIKTWTPSEVALGRELRKVTPSLITDQKKHNEDGSYSRVYRFKDLESVRAEWNKRMGFDRTWE